MAEILQTIKSKSGGRVLAVFYDDGTIRIDGGRLSFPHLDKPWAKPTKANPDPKLVYSGSVILDKKEYRQVKDALVKHNEQLMKEAKIEFVKADAKYIVDGNETGRAENADSWVVRFREDRKPFVKGLKNENLSEAAIKQQLYGGCVVSVLIRPWAQNSADWGKRLNCGFSSVRLMGAGEAFGEGGIGEEDVTDRMADVDTNGGFEEEEDDEDYGGL